MITRALILAAGKGISVGDDAGAQLPDHRRGAARCSSGRWGCSRAVGVQKIGITVGYGGAAVRRHVAGSTALSAATQAAHHLLREPGLGRAERAVGAGGAGLRDRADAAGDGRSDRGARRWCASWRALAGGGRPHRALRRPRSGARVRHRRRDEGEAGAAIASPRSARGSPRYDAVSAGLFVMAPSLLEALAQRCREPSLTEGVAAAARARAGRRARRRRASSGRTSTRPR